MLIKHYLPFFNFTSSLHTGWMKNIHYLEWQSSDWLLMVIKSSSMGSFYRPVSKRPLLLTFPGHSKHTLCWLLSSQCKHTVMVVVWRVDDDGEELSLSYLIWSVCSGEERLNDIVTDGEHSWYLICDSGNTHTRTVSHRRQDIYWNITCTYKDNNTHSAGGLTLNLYFKSTVVVFYVCSAAAYTAAVNHFIASQAYLLTYSTRSPRAYKRQVCWLLFSTCSSAFFKLWVHREQP